MEKVKVALVGAGNIANQHLESYKNVADAEVYAICDIDPVRLKMTADKFGIERRYPDFDAKGPPGAGRRRCLRLELLPCGMFDQGVKCRAACFV